MGDLRDQAGAASLDVGECGGQPVDVITGEVYTAGGGQVARFFTGRTQGYYNPSLSIEDVRDHLTEIRDETGYTIPAGATEEITQLLRTVAAGRKP
ncbi:hypothetical protein ACIBI9_20240 [Nonomuraea sp. NPDC050451]|uniref:hypothetical protein n=1 Tax=Nonomuraea sp. NPDC050451 TaxID=3364364 RepID=UPI0037B73413